MGAATEPPSWFTEALAQQPSIGHTTVGGVRIADRSWGEGPLPTVVLVHGGGAHSRWWDHVAPLLAVDRRVVALDLAGHGDSGRRPRYSIDSWADDLDAIVDGSGPRPIVIGHSLGGMVTLRLAQRLGHSLGGVALLDSIIGAATVDRTDRASYVAFGPLRRYDSQAAAIARFRPVPFQYCEPWLLEHVAATSVARFDDGWSWKFDNLVFADELYLPLPTEPLACRAAYLRAEHGLLSQAAARRIGESLGCAIVADLPAAGHHLMLDQPLALVAALRLLLATWDDATLAITRSSTTRSSITRSATTSSATAPE